MGKYCLVIMIHNLILTKLVVFVEVSELTNLMTLYLYITIEGIFFFNF